MRFVLCILLFLVFSQTSYGWQAESSDQYQIVKDLRSELMVYDSEFSSYIPYNSTLHSGARYFTLKLDSTTLNQYPLVISLNAGSAIFLDNKLYMQQKENGWVSLGKKQLAKSIWLTIFHPRGNLPVNTIFYGFKLNEKLPVKVAVNRLETRPYHSIVFQNFFIILFILILIALAISKVFNNKAYDEFYNIRRNAISIGKDQNYIFKKPLNSNNLLSLFIHCMIFVFTFFVIQYFTKGLINLRLFNPENSLIEILANYFTYTIIVFVVYVLKYFLIAFISYLYNVREYKLTHYFNWVKLSMLFFLIIFPIVSLIYIWYEDLNQLLIYNIVFFSLIAFSIAKIIIITYNLNKIRPFRNLYLFSYLCATEIIPLFIVFKLLI